MAARYVDTANIVAQGQSFYTGLLPGSYDKGGGGGGGSNVMGRGSAGNAGVGADRTGSTAAMQSITDYKGGKSIFKDNTSDADRVIKAIKEGPDGPQPLPGPSGPQGQNPAPGLPWGQNQGPVTAPQGGMGTGKKTQHQGGGTSKVLGTAVGAGVGTYVGGQTGNPALGRAAGVASGAIATHGFEKMGDKLSESPIGRSVQRMASTRSHTRQPGVQQSATQQSIPFPNLANSTDRSLNF